MERNELRINNLKTTQGTSGARLTGAAAGNPSTSRKHGSFSDKETQPLLYELHTSKRD